VNSRLSLVPSSDLQIFVGFRCTFVRGKNLSGCWNVERRLQGDFHI
jgi:hypothetical protein